MPQSQVFTLDHADEYQAAIRAGTYEVFVKSKGDFHAQLARIDLHRLWMQRSKTNLPWIMNAANDPARTPLLFLADADQAPLGESGTEVSAGEILFYRQGATKHSWTSGRSHLASMSLTHEDLAAAGEAINGRALTAPPNSNIVRPEPAAMARLMALHQTAGDLAKTAPAILAAPGVAQALEQKLIHAMVACLRTDAPAERRSCGWQHSKVIARLQRFLEARQYQPVYLAEMCAAIGVSERTLRTCCQEHFGMGPVRYLWLRRMHLARRGMLRADAGAVTVTTIATEYGFWELGRFSVEYRGLFGESPSATLRRQPDATPAQTAWQ
jgi:AraC-like DNA-binding protein